MRAHVLAVLLAIGASPVAAQPVGPNPPQWTIQCIGVGGDLEPTVCQAPGSRLDQRELICSCPRAGLRVEVPICMRGDRPPPEGVALQRVRRVAARDGALYGDLFRGRQICAQPRQMFR